MTDWTDLIPAPSGVSPTRPSGLVLTARQVDVAELAAAGLTNPAIAEALGLSLNTVKAHLHALMLLAAIRAARAAIRMGRYAEAYAVLGEAQS